MTRRDTVLEREFRNACISFRDKVALKIEEASHSLQQAVDMAEQKGIPFRTHISFLSQDYCPMSFKTKFPDLETYKAAGISGTSIEEYSWGWQHSMVC